MVVRCPECNKKVALESLWNIDEDTIVCGDCYQAFHSKEIRLEQAGTSFAKAKNKTKIKRNDERMKDK